MCRTAIGLLVASTTILPAAAQSCQTEDLMEALTRSEPPQNKYWVAPDASEDPCWVMEILSDRLQDLRNRQDPQSEDRAPVDSNIGDLGTPPVYAAISPRSVEIGIDAVARSGRAIAIGSNALSEEFGAVAIGASAIATPTESLAIGLSANVEERALNGMAIGPNAHVFTGAAQSIAVGAHSYVGAPGGIALGYLARSTAPGSIALGTRSVADEANTVSLGREDNPETELDETLLRRLTNLAAGTADTDAVNYAQLQSALESVDFSSDYFAINATGPNARAQGANSIALGSNAFAGSNGSVAFGAGAKSLFHNAYAIGANAQTSRESQFMFGTRLSNYSLPGLANPQSRLLQTGDLQLVTVDESGTLAGDGGATVSNLRSNIAVMDEGIQDLHQQISDHAAGLDRGLQERGALSRGLALLEHQVTEHSSGLSNLRDRIAAFANLPEEVDALGRDVTENSSSIANIEQTLAGGIARPEDIDGLDDRISENSSSISSLEQSVAANANLRDDVASLGRTVDDHSTSIAGLERGLAETAAFSEQTAEQLDALDGRVATNGAGIHQNAGSIQENRVAIEGNSASIDRLEESASNGAVRFDAIETSVSTQAARIDDIDHSISTHENQIAENTERMETVKSIASENQAWIARNQAGLAEQGEAISMLQTDFEQLGLNVYGLAQTVAYQAEQIETNRRGIAIANALAGSSWLQANETTALTLNAGYFEGSSALAFSGTRRLHKLWSANVAVGTDTERGEIGARAGLRSGW